MENRNKYWTLEEEEILMDLYKDKNLKINHIAKILKRSSNAINSRLIKLNIDSSNKNILEELKEIKNELKKILLIIKNNNTTYTEV